MFKYFTLLPFALAAPQLQHGVALQTTAWTYEEGDSADQLAPYAHVDADDSASYSSFYKLKQQIYGGGFRDACPVMDDDLPASKKRKKRQTVDLGFTDDDCLFPKINQSADFEQVFVDCHGAPLPAGQTWYRSVVPFNGKSNSIYYVGDDIRSFSRADNFCRGVINGQPMPIGSHLWCPNSETEAAWLWHHHPAQPFGPSNITDGLLTGIWAESRANDNNKDYWCQQGINAVSNARYVIDPNYRNWGTNEPNYGIQRNVNLKMTNPKWMDGRAYREGNFYCELNCDTLTVCEALNCENNDAVCIDNGTLENSYCECNDANLDWSPISKTCSETVEVVIPMLFPEGQKTLLKAALDAVNGNLSRRRKKRSTRKNRFKRAITNTDFDQIMQHGCHCIKLDQDFTGLGGRTTIDSMDGLCQDWTVARRCITLNGGTCHNQDISLDSYTVNINKNTGEVDCSPNDGLLDDCVKDACAIDALNVQFILQELRDSQDPFLAIQGDEITCPACHNCVVPAGCRGTAPNVSPVSWIDFNQNGL